LDGLKKSTIATTSDSVSFSLGDLHSSKNFYFLLENAGSTPITNISLSTDDSDFEVEPSSISVLNPQNGLADSQAAVQPIIRVEAVHGTSLDGTVGFRQLMPEGLNHSNLRISGTTSAGNTTVVVRLSVNALLLDADIRQDNGQLVAFTKPPDWLALGSSPTGASLPIYKVTGDTFTIINDGNVPLIISGERYLRALSFDKLWSKTLSVSDSTTFLPDSSDIASGILIALDGNNTIANRAKFNNDADGKVYVELVWRP